VPSQQPSGPETSGKHAALASAPKKRAAFTPEERNALEEKGRKYLSRKPKASRDDFARHLDVGAGTASNLAAWKNRQSRKTSSTSKTRPPSGKKIGLNVAIDKTTKPTHYSVKQQQEEIDALIDEQAAEARVDDIKLDTE
jgi:hypothetical protein